MEEKKNKQEQIVHWEQVDWKRLDIDLIEKQWIWSYKLLPRDVNRIVAEYVGSADLLKMWPLCMMPWLSKRLNEQQVQNELVCCKVKRCPKKIKGHCAMHFFHYTGCWDCERTPGYKIMGDAFWSIPYELHQHKNQSLKKLSCWLAMCFEVCILGKTPEWAVDHTFRHVSHGLGPGLSEQDKNVILFEIFSVFPSQR